MKVDFKSFPLSEVCQIRPPKSEAREKLSPKSLVSFVPMENLGIDQKFLNPKQNRPLSEVDGSYTYFGEGDVLLAKITPCFENGKLGIAKGLINRIGFGSSEFIVFRPNKYLDKEYLYYFLSRPDFRTEGSNIMGGAVGQQRVPKEFIESYPIPVPSIIEQKRIVGILDEAFEGIATAKANAEKNLQNARAIFDSYLYSVFTHRGEGWVEKTLGEVCETTQGVQIEKNLHFKSPGMNRKRYLYISDFDHEENLKYVEDIYPKKRVTKKDLIVVNTGATAGKIFRGIDGVLSNNLFKVTINPTEVDGEFLYYFVTSSLFKNHQKKIVKGTANPHMGHENFKSTSLKIPSLKVQVDTVAKLDALSTEVQRLESIYLEKYSALDNLKKSILIQAFAGEL